MCGFLILEHIQKRISKTKYCGGVESVTRYSWILNKRVVRSKN